VSPAPDRAYEEFGHKTCHFGARPPGGIGEARRNGSRHKFGPNDFEHLARSVPPDIKKTGSLRTFSVEMGSANAFGSEENYFAKAES
jgi:hypothetical protein